MNPSVARGFRPPAASMLAAMIICALIAAASGGAPLAGSRVPAHRTPVLNWLPGDTGPTDSAPPDLSGSLPLRRPPVPSVSWRPPDAGTSVPHDRLVLFHVTRIALPPPRP